MNYDNLALAYNGNQLRKVSDAADVSTNSITEQFLEFARTDSEYAYNANGAMTKDLNKGISSISYNLLNLPQQVDILSPLAEARNNYSYSADGVKLRVVKKYNSTYNASPIIGSGVNVSLMDVTKTTDYVDGKIFENNVLDRIFVDGGYIKNGVYYFYETDHLGDNRTVINQSGTVVERNDYYPYGMQMGHNDPNKGLALLSDGSAKTAFKFSGKELDVMHGLNLYDFSARSHDPTLGRFTTVDPKAEKYYSISLYAYCAGNPVNAVDIDGNLTIFINGLHSGNYGKGYWREASNFDLKFLNRFHEDPKTAIYLDGAIGGLINTVVGGGNHNTSVINRIEAGRSWGKQNVVDLIAQLQRDVNGNIVEKLRIVTHSMGAAYGKGVQEAILTYLYEHPDLNVGLSIDNYDFDPFQAASLKPKKEVYTYQALHNGSLANEKEPGIDDGDDHHGFKDDSDYSTSHSLGSFAHLIENLPEGKYVWNGTGFVKQ